MVKRIILCAFMLLAGSIAGAQKNSSNIPDTLAAKDYEYFRIRYQETKRENISLVYAHSWLAKSKAERNYGQMALAYQAILYKTDKKLHLAYTDSILNSALLSKDDVSIGAAYLTKGTTYFGIKKLSLALDNYIIADEYILRTGDTYLTYKVKYAIAQTKYYLGFYDEAIALYKECLAYFREENDRAYLNSLHSIGLCYNKIRRYDLCTFYNQKGIKEGREFENDEMVSYFNHSEGINQYCLKNFNTSIKLLMGSLQIIKERKDFANEIVAWFYLGKNYKAIGNNNLAYVYFKKVDAAIARENYIRPDLRENFEILIDQYKKEENLHEQLRYVNKLLHADSVLYADFRYLSGKIHKEYDTKKLQQDKSNIENTLRTNKIVYASIITVLIGCITALSYRYYKRERHFRKKYEELKANDLEIINPVIKVESTYRLNIAEEIENRIVKKLEKFEQGTKFLEHEMSSRRLADILQTNTKYVSWIIPKYRGTKTIDYISDLKIHYMVKLLKTEKIYRNYTNTALADKAGFGSTQNFTKAFKARAGISPTEFIDELRKKENESEIL